MVDMVEETLTPFPRPGTPCIVCGEAIPAESGAYCEGCAGPFHLNQKAGATGRECGQVWISDEHLGLVFGCNRCLAPKAEVLADVLDLQEAALVAQVEMEVLEAAARAGELVYRTTSGGTILFMRGDVVEWAERRART